jgi:phospholipid N-methyltransferase
MYLKKFFEDPLVGAVVPSSPFCVKKVTQKMHFSGKKVIVEYGSGAGEFTRHFLDRMDDDAVLVALETNPAFIVQLNKIGDKRLKVVHDSAENVSAVLNKLGLGKADYIISGIPFTLLPLNTRKSIVAQSAENLRSDGSFIVYQYSTYVKRFLKKHFLNISTDFTLLNFPPMFVMKASEKVLEPESAMAG